MVVTTELELVSASIPGSWASLLIFLKRYAGHPIAVAYEAGFSGFWLYDHVIENGFDCIVTPPSHLPVESGNRVKTDRRDSRKLALLLSKGMLKEVWVPDVQLRSHRQVCRRRRQLIMDRIRVQNRIKSELFCFGVTVAVEGEVVSFVCGQPSFVPIR